MIADAATVAALLAVDASGLGGVALRSSAGVARDEWLGLLKQLLPASAPFRRIPLNINDTALLGGLDLGATLHAGRPVAQQGVLAQSDGGVVLLAMAERLSLGAAARLAAVLDTHEVAIERDSLTVRRLARIGVVALDEGIGDDEKLPAALLDRLAFHLVLDGRADFNDAVGQVTWQVEEVDRARVLLPRVVASDETLQALCAAALALGIDSLRAPLLALRAARAAAALSGQTEVCEEHVAVAARLVLAPRATRLPATPPAEETEEQADTQAQDEQNEQLASKPEDAPSDAAAPDSSDSVDDRPSDTDPTESEVGSSLAETVLEAAQAAIPPGLLAALKLGEAAKSRAQAAGRSGAAQKSQLRGRPLGARRGEPRAGARLNVIETLRAAAPWQKLRQREAALRALQSPSAESCQLKAGLKAARRVYVRREDFHITRFKQVGQTTTLFVVDASGSSALNRLAEAKGAVELLLADCYIRRDRVSVLGFRGKTAELLLPPTRSLARAKRSLAGLPGGGGTPLATAIDAARELADQISRRGETPIIVLLTDGRGNIARDGAPGRTRAGQDALAAARQLRIAGVTCLLMDTSPQPQPTAQLLAQEMGAAYVPLPYAGAKMLSQVVRLASATASR